MFCVLTVKRRKDSVFEKLFPFAIKDDYELTTVPVIKGSPFYQLSVTVGKKGVDYKRVIYEVGRCAEKLVIDEDITLPKIRGIGEFKSDILYHKMIENTANVLIEKLGEDAVYKRALGTIIYKENTLKIGEDKNDFNLPYEYLHLLPKQVEKYQFASALYELCGVFSLGNSLYNSVIVNGEKKNIESIIFS